MASNLRPAMDDDLTHSASQRRDTEICNAYAEAGGSLDRPVGSGVGGRDVQGVSLPAFLLVLPGLVFRGQEASSSFLAHRTLRMMAKGCREAVKEPFKERTLRHFITELLLGLIPSEQS